MKEPSIKREKIRISVVYSVIFLLLVMGTVWAIIDSWSSEGRNAARILFLSIPLIVYLLLTGTQWLLFHFSNVYKKTIANTILGLSLLKGSVSFLFFTANTIIGIARVHPTAENVLRLTSMILLALLCAAACILEILGLVKMRQKKFGKQQESEKLPLDKNKLIILIAIQAAGFVLSGILVTMCFLWAFGEQELSGIYPLFQLSVPAFVGAVLLVVIMLGIIAGMVMGIVICVKKLIQAK